MRISVSEKLSGSKIPIKEYVIINEESSEQESKRKETMILF